MTDKHKNIEQALRHVEIPADLKRSLHHIAEESTDQLPSPRKPSENRSLRMGPLGLLVLAASIVGLALFVIRPSTHESTTAAKKDAIGKPASQAALHHSPKPLRTTDSLLEEMRSNSVTLQLKLMKRNTELLNSKLDEYDSRAMLSSQIELTSVLLCVANQAGIDYGNNIESVAEDMRQVIAEFPGTSGAKLAGLFLDKTIPNSEF